VNMPFGYKWKLIGFEGLINYFWNGHNLNSNVWRSFLWA
jgi:hypothetical protein